MEGRHSDVGVECEQQNLSPTGIIRKTVTRMLGWSVNNKTFQQLELYGRPSLGCWGGVRTTKPFSNWNYMEDRHSDVGVEYEQQNLSPTGIIWHSVAITQLFGVEYEQQNLSPTGIIWKATTRMLGWSMNNKTFHQLELYGRQSLGCWGGV